MKNINYPPWLTKTYRNFAHPVERLKQAITSALRIRRKTWSVPNGTYFSFFG